MRLKGTADNRMLYGVLAAGGVLILILIALAAGGGKGTDRVKGLAVPCRILPVWDGSPTPEAVRDPSPGAKEIRVYLDTSQPIGGYLPPPGETAEPVFRAVTQLVPGHLVGPFSGAVRWLGVDSTIHPLRHDLLLSRSLFNGRETRLDLALDDLLKSLESGRAEAAVLVTDLVSTSGPEGAMGAAEPLLRWVRTEGVRSGRYDLGLLAARAEYWGVSSSRCTGPGALGCWYSEQSNRYLPMTKVAKRPLYFLFFGLSGEGSDAGDIGKTRVEEAGTSFQSALHDLGLETRWELLTKGSRGRAGSLVCSVSKPRGSAGPKGSTDHPEDQFALVRTSDGRFECRRNEKVLLSCCVSTGNLKGANGSCNSSGIRLESARASWQEVSVRADKGRLQAIVDCAALREKAPSGPLRFEDVVASENPVQARSWSDWSTRSDEEERTLLGTLQMNLFVEAVRLRPDHYRIDLETPVLRFAR